MSRWAGVLLFWFLEYAVLAFLHTAVELGSETWSEDGIWMDRRGQQRRERVRTTKRKSENDEEKE